MTRLLAGSLVIAAVLGAVVLTWASMFAQGQQVPDLATLRSQARQLVADSAFDLSQHGVADSQHLIVRQPGPPEIRSLGPYARAWPRADNHRQDVGEVVGRIVTLIVSDSPYASLGLPAGSSYVYVESLDPQQSCVQGQTSNGQVRIVPADQRYDAQTTLEQRTLCYAANPITERGLFGIGRRPQRNHRASVEWRSPNDGIWFACASHGCCYVGGVD